MYANENNTTKIFLRNHLSKIVLPPYHRPPSPVRVEGAPICKLFLFDLVELQTRSDLFVLCHHYQIMTLNVIMA